MRIVLTALGTVGDVAPMLRIAEALEAGGARTLVFVNPFFEAHARSLGLSVRAVGEPWDPEQIARDPQLYDPSHVFRQVFVPPIEAEFRAIGEALAESPTAGVVSHFWCFGGVLAAEARRVPWAAVSLAPIAWLSVRDPSQIAAFPIPPWILRSVIRWLVRPRTLELYEPHVQRAARALGLPELPNRYWGMQTRAALNVGLWSPSWRAPAADDPTNARIVGFPAVARNVAALVGAPGASDPGARLPPPIESFLREASAEGGAVVMGMGSVPSVSEPLYREAARACVALGRRALLVGASENLDAEFGPTIRTAAAVPYAAVFPRASVVLHHGGVGSMTAGLRAGRPAIAMPFANDQFDNAARLERLGAGIALPQRRALHGGLRAAIARCLASRTMAAKAAAVARKLATEEDGAVVAAREIRLAFDRRPGAP
ncbi:MAG TPA: glycosyltransferase [Polyangiaceae bacterium]|jgi:rhamnosyltransferase subunit B|nr:glycosyltransferase [Polyangiaceae bacterium]